MSFEGRPTGRYLGVSAIFDPSKLTLARQLAGLRKSELAERVSMAPASVSAWEAGTQKPNESAVARLSLALGVGVQFFAIGASTSRTPLPSTPHFRSLRATSQRVQDQAYAYGQVAAEVAALLEKTVEFPAARVPKRPVDGLVVTPGAAEAAARFARKELDLADGPVPHLVRLMENAGILVVFSAPQTASIDAFSFEGHQRPVIVLNPEKDDYYRQRFDVAHEFAHLVMHTDAEPGGRIVEDQAHRFAAEFLMPAAEIAPLLPRVTTGRGWATLAELKEHWGVSIASLLYRAKTLGVMGDVSYRNAMITISQRGWRRAEPGRVNLLEMPSLLPRALEVLEGAGVSIEHVMDGPGLPRTVFETISSRTPTRTG